MKQSHDNKSYEYDRERLIKLKKSQNSLEPRRIKMLLRNAILIQERRKIPLIMSVSIKHAFGIVELRNKTME